jgi:exodeoxyribonuclease X
MTDAPEITERKNSSRQSLSASFAQLRTSAGIEEQPSIADGALPSPVKLGKKLTDVKFIILDTETTGANVETAHVIEVAARAWSLGKYKKFPRVFETKVDPGVKIPPSSSAVHHITDRDVAGCPVLEEIVPELMTVIGDAPIVAFNSEFDRKMLRGTPLYDRYWVDVYRLAMRTWHVGEVNENGFALESLKQQELRYWLGLREVGGDAHRAAADILVTGLVFQTAADRYLKSGMADDYDGFIEWLESPIFHKTIPIGARGVAGKQPEDLEDWQLKKMFDPTNEMRESLTRFNILDFARPEYMRRQLGDTYSGKTPPRRPYK